MESKSKEKILSGHLYGTFLILIILSCNNFNALPVTLSDTINKDPDYVLQASYSQGWVLKTNSFLLGSNIKNRPINYIRTCSALFTKQTKGDKLWEQLYLYPRYGMGINVIQFINASYLGTPFSIYGTLSLPLVRWQNFTFYTNINLGIAFNWVSYKNDRYNIAIGASETMYFNEGISLEYESESGLMFNAGLSLTHFSTGSLKVPNRGINTIAPGIGVGYNFNGKPKNFKYQIIPEYKKQSDLYFTFFGAVRNDYYWGDEVDTVQQYKGVYYEAYGLSLSFNRQISYKSKFGAGIMADYYGLPQSYITVENGKLIAHPGSFRDGFELSIFPSYELIINRLSLIVQPGFYIYRSKYEFRTPNVYQRVGFKINILNNLSFAAYLRVHYYSIADYIEWTVIYRLKL